MQNFKCIVWVFNVNLSSSISLCAQKHSYNQLYLPTQIQPKIMVVSWHFDWNSTLTLPVASPMSNIELRNDVKRGVLPRNNILSWGWGKEEESWFRFGLSSHLLSSSHSGRCSWLGLVDRVDMAWNPVEIYPQILHLTLTHHCLCSGIGCWVDTRWSFSGLSFF